MRIGGFCRRCEREESSVHKPEKPARFVRQVWACCVRSRFYGQATKGVCVDALAQVGDEGRDQLR